MREYVIAGTGNPYWRDETPAAVLGMVEANYVGGVAAFLSDHDEQGRRCCPSCGTLATVLYDPAEEEGCCEVCPAVRPLRDHGNEGGEGRG
jgi:hypothetical protein